MASLIAEYIFHLHLQFHVQQIRSRNFSRLLQVRGLRRVAGQTGRHPSPGDEAALALHGPGRRRVARPGRRRTGSWSLGRRHVVPEGRLHTRHHAGVHASQPPPTSIQPGAGLGPTHPGPRSFWLRPRAGSCSRSVRFVLRPDHSIQSALIQRTGESPRVTAITQMGFPACMPTLPSSAQLRDPHSSFVSPTLSFLWTRPALLPQNFCRLSLDLA